LVAQPTGWPWRRLPGPDGGGVSTGDGGASPLTEDERAAVDDGNAALDQLLDRLADIPTPAGPTPRQLDPPGTATILPIIDVRQAQSGSI
jgi:hypothetical protein